MRELKTTEPIDLMDGEYNATWSGWIVTVHTLDGDVEAATTSKIGGTMEMDVIIENGEIFYDK